jgi:hypothetical protein
MREMTVIIFLNNIDLRCTIEVNDTNYDNGFEIVSAYLSDSNINIADLLDEVELSKAVYIKLKLSEL